MEEGLERGFAWSVFEKDYCIKGRLQWYQEFGCVY